MPFTLKAPARWRPARLRPFDVGLVTLLLIVVAAFRGLDYLTGDDSGARSPQPGKPSALVGIEAAAPLHLWGWLIILGVALIAVGMWRRWHFPVWVGHVVLFATYLGLCVGLLPAYLGRSDFDGIRTATGLIVPVGLHLLLWFRMGPRPVDPWRADAREPA